jgi:hypothetical protein
MTQELVKEDVPSLRKKLLSLTTTLSQAFNPLIDTILKDHREILEESHVEFKNCFDGEIETLYKRLHTPFFSINTNISSSHVKSEVLKKPTLTSIENQKIINWGIDLISIEHQIKRDLVKIPKDLRKEILGIGQELKSQNGKIDQKSFKETLLKQSSFFGLQGSSNVSKASSPRNSQEERKVDNINRKPSKCPSPKEKVTSKQRDTYKGRLKRKVKTLISQFGHFQGFPVDLNYESRCNNTSVLAFASIMNNLQSMQWQWARKNLYKCGNYKLQNIEYLPLEIPVSFKSLWIGNKLVLEKDKDQTELEFYKLQNSEGIAYSQAPKDMPKILTTPVSKTVWEDLIKINPKVLWLQEFKCDPDGEVTLTLE